MTMIQDLVLGVELWISGGSDFMCSLHCSRIMSVALRQAYEYGIAACL